MTWDIAPSQNLIAQDWGCTSYDQEWYAPWCPGGHYHAGIDLGYSGGGNVTCGRPVYATRGGTVVAVGANGQGNSGFSQYLGPNAVCVHYDDGMYVEHGHLSAATVTVGQRVEAGHQLGNIGTLGDSSACHLHVEARVDGPYQGVANNAANVRDPRPYLNALPAPAPPSPINEEELVRIIIPADGNQYLLFANGQLCRITDPQSSHALAQSGIPVVSVTNAQRDQLLKLPVNQGV